MPVKIQRAILIFALIVWNVWLVCEVLTMNETIYGLLLMALGVAVIVQTWRIGRLKREVRHYRSYYEMRFARGGEWKGAAVYFGEQTCGYQPLEDPEGEPPSGVGGVVK